MSVRNQRRSPLVEKTVEMDVVFAHMGLDMQAHRLTDGWQALERAPRGKNEIADTADIDHRLVDVGGGKGAGEGGDHGWRPVSDTPDPPVPAASASRRAAGVLR